MASQKDSVSIRFVVLFLFSFASSVLIIEITENFEPYKEFLVAQLNNYFNAPTYAIYGSSKDEDHLVHVIKLLHLFGYKRTDVHNKWNLLWAHDYPFLNQDLHLKTKGGSQIINHFPGCGFITNKVDLSTSQLPFLPAAFRLPKEKEIFLNYVKINPKSLFVEKHNEHRHIYIKSPEEINLNSNNSFVQEFIQKPYLVDGYKFDIGIYVVITSVDPLRVYIYNGDVLFRYCAEKYYPFDKRNVNKYVVGDDYLPTWEVPSLKKYYNQYSGSMRAAFDAYVRDNGQDPSTVWQQVESIIRETIISKEYDILQIVRSYKHRNFFDLIRFDLIIDENLKVHLMEANMSPNLSSAHFKQNSLLYEQILYSVLNLVGIGSPVSWSLPKREEIISDIITADKNIAVGLNTCARNDCNLSCDKAECDLCLPCLRGSEIEILKKSHREHLHRIDMKRIFPTPIKNPNEYNLAEETKHLTKSNKWLSRWYYFKCKDDIVWCC